MKLVKDCTYMYRNKWFTFNLLLNGHLFKIILLFIKSKGVLK